MRGRYPGSSYPRLEKIKIIILNYLVMMSKWCYFDTTTEDKKETMKKAKLRKFTLRDKTGILKTAEDVIKLMKVPVSLNTYILEAINEKNSKTK